ncbi:MAG: ribonuclease HII [Candidatus Eremiobacteraeota bacterium]|nr:ribonuclease HII [Candidatus Eremiobacteraeota bacterium]MBV8340366.1 ribonuclease HII [Candidatus Eremiobacteraeota bacterium]
MCGVDEVGRGPLAGPVVACAVVIDQPLYVEFLDDSKTVTELRRTALADTIRSKAVGFALGWATPDEIDRVNILGASKLAMGRALAGLAVNPDQVLVDAVRIPQCPFPQLAIVDGDAKSAVIAAASIVAKVFRDRWMDQCHSLYPDYGFAQNKGYATLEHLRALASRGPSPIHRRTFAPVLQPSFDFLLDGTAL